MSLEINSALYYPQIEFSDYRWLWAAALVWDKIYRIEPDDFTPEHPDNVKALCDGGDIGIPIRPKEYAKTVAEEFMVHISTGKWMAAALEKKQVKEYARIHHQKIDVQIRQMLISSGRAASRDQWLYVPEDFEKLYMTYLATKIAAKNNLQAVSDASGAWAGLTYFKNGWLETESDVHDLPFALASLTIGKFVPRNITDITPQKLLKFREKYSDERRNFMRAIKASAKLLANCHDAKVAEEMFQEIQKDIAGATADYRQSMDFLNATTFAGCTTASIPITTPVLKGLLPIAAEPAAILGTTVLALGAIAGMAALRQKGKRLQKDCDYSYLVHAEKDFPTTIDALSVPNRLRYDLNEFIND